MNDPLSEDLASLVHRQAAHHGDRVFMRFGDGSTMTYAGFGARVDTVRDHVLSNGLGGRRVAVMMKNSLSYPVIWLGVAAAGATAVPVNSRLGPEDTRFILTHSGAAAAFVDDGTEATVRAAAPSSLRQVVVGEPAPATAAPDLPAVGPESLANIQYTSGTTGFPKGCLLTHRFWQVMGATAIDTMSIGEDDVLLTSQAHSYIDPQWNVIAALRAGAELVLLDGFHPSTFMDDVARFGVTVFYCLGVMPTLLLKQPPDRSDREHRLKRVYCSAIPVDQHSEIEARWSVPWFEVFGMTETGINIGVPPVAHDRCVGSGSIGLPVVHNEAAIVDEEDRELAPGEVGELVVRGPGMMNGYHDDPDATAAFFRNGWAHTGDLATCDDDGFVYLKGRRKEMIRRGGENIAPVEVEVALGGHPAVLECAVAGVPDPDMGEELKAYVVVRPGAEWAPEELHAHLRSRLASFKVPRYWEPREALPHTASEKIAKHTLEEGRDPFGPPTVDLARSRRSRTT